MMGRYLLNPSTVLPTSKWENCENKEGPTKFQNTISFKLFALFPKKCILKL